MTTSPKKWAVRRGDDFQDRVLRNNTIRCGSCCCLTFLGIGAGLLIGGISGFVTSFREDGKPSYERSSIFYTIGQVTLGVLGSIALLWIFSLFKIQLGFLSLLIVPLGGFLPLFLDHSSRSNEGWSEARTVKAFTRGIGYAFVGSVLGAFIGGFVCFFFARLFGSF